MKINDDIFTNDEIKLKDKQMEELIWDVINNVDNASLEQIEQVKNLWLKKGYGYKKIDIANEEMIQLINKIHFQEQSAWINTPFTELKLQEKLNDIMNMYNKAYEEK
jgi:hypothetical protein